MQTHGTNTAHEREQDDKGGYEEMNINERQKDDEFEYEEMSERQKDDEINYEEMSGRQKDDEYVYEVINLTTTSLVKSENEVNSFPQSHYPLPAIPLPVTPPTRGNVGVAKEGEEESMYDNIPGDHHEKEECDY